jgi:hypothetical protein
MESEPARLIGRCDATLRQFDERAAAEKWRWPRCGIRVTRPKSKPGY